MQQNQIIRRVRSQSDNTTIFVTVAGIEVRTLRYYEQQWSLSQIDIGRFVHKITNFGGIKTNSDPF